MANRGARVDSWMQELENRLKTVEEELNDEEQAEGDADGDADGLNNFDAETSPNQNQMISLPAINNKG